MLESKKHVIVRRNVSVFLLEIGSVSADSFKYKAAKLMDGSDYFFRVAAQNAVGVGPFTTSDALTAKLPFGKGLLSRNSFI